MLRVLIATATLLALALTTTAATAGVMTFPSGGWGKDIHGGSGKVGPAGGSTPGGVQSTAGTNPEG